MNPLTNLHLSDVTLITAALGVFFLTVAFYKSIFHKRRPPVHTTVAHTRPKNAPPANQPVKLADPYQQVPVDAIPQDPHPPLPAASFYPASPQPANSAISAFRQFNPQKEFDAASAPTKNESTYEWE